ncbi:MAG: TetR/AcrR family transcriptional regulator [Methanosphaera stadtmanae]|nr:TetR/AcrR family transcriptional regulator [Methanosphaera stadtmanae]
MNDKQQRIIESSIKIFSKKGYGSTTTAEIARDAKVSVGTLFNYYSNKQQLVNELYLYANKDYCDYTKNLEEKNDFKKGMIELWGKCIDYALNNQDIFRFIVIFRNSPVITDETIKQINDESKFFENVYNKFRKRNEVKMYYDLFSYIMFGCLIATLEFIEKNPEKEINHIKEISFDYLWDGVNP